MTVAKSVLHTIESNFGSFSKGQKRIANYILQNYDKAAFMTANRLGKLVGVSESTVVRFASELGYDGYPSMWWRNWSGPVSGKQRSRAGLGPEIQLSSDPTGR